MPMVQEAQALVIQADKNAISKHFPTLSLKFCYDVFAGCDVDHSKTEARFLPEDKDEAQRVYELLQKKNCTPVKNW